MIHWSSVLSDRGCETSVDTDQHSEMVSPDWFDEMLVRMHKRSDASIQLDYQNHDHPSSRTMDYRREERFHSPLGQQSRYLGNESSCRIDNEKNIEALTADANIESIVIFIGYLRFLVNFVVGKRGEIRVQPVDVWR